MIVGVSPRTKFILFALLVLIMAPFVIFLVPLAYFETVYVQVESWQMLIPKQNFILLGAGFLCLIIILLLLAWKRRAITYILGAVLLVGAVLIFFQSQRNYIAFQDSGIEMLVYGNVKHYYWEDMKDITYEVYEPYDDEVNYYIFRMEDGESFEVVENAQLAEKKGKILQIIREYDIKFIENYHD
ncbi:MAG: hypothetical protein ACI33P_05140 [Lysinibacillus sp.]